MLRLLAIAKLFVHAGQVGVGHRQGSFFQQPLLSRLLHQPGALLREPQRFLATPRFPMRNSHADECLALLYEFEKNFPYGHVYGKFGSGRPGLTTKVVVFHAGTETERDRLQAALEQCLPRINVSGPIQISRGCAVLHHDLFGSWEDWQPVTPIKCEENIENLLNRIKNILYRSAM